MSVHGIKMVFKNLIKVIISYGHAMVFYSAINNANTTSCYSYGYKQIRAIKAELI